MVVSYRKYPFLQALSDPEFQIHVLNDDPKFMPVARGCINSFREVKNIMMPSAWFMHAMEENYEKLKFFWNYVRPQEGIYLHKNTGIYYFIGSKVVKVAVFYEKYLLQVFSIDRPTPEEVPIYASKTPLYVHLVPGQVISTLFAFLLLKDFGAVETITLSAKYKNHKAKLLGEVHFSNVGINVTLVDSSWLRSINVVGTYKVSGHFRMQGYGKNRSEYYKLIYIDSYVKNGYKRQAKKLQQ